MGSRFAFYALDEAVGQVESGAEAAFAAIHLAGVGFVIVAGEVKQAVRMRTFNSIAENGRTWRLAAGSGDADGEVAGEFFLVLDEGFGGEGENVGGLVDTAGNWRLRRRMAASVVSRTLTWPRSLTAAWPARENGPMRLRRWEAGADMGFRCWRSPIVAQCRLRGRGSSLGRAPDLGRGGSSCARLPGGKPSIQLQFYATHKLTPVLAVLCAGCGGLRCNAFAQRQRQLLLLRLGRLVGAHDPLHQRMADHVAVLKVAEVNALDAVQDVDRVHAGRTCADWADRSG